MNNVLQWSPLLAALGAPLLAWLVVAGGPSLRRPALLVAIVAVLTLLATIAAILVAYAPGSPLADSGLYRLPAAVYDVTDPLTSFLAIAAWVLLLSGAARAGRRSRLVALTVVFALALLLQLASAFLLLLQGMDSLLFPLLLRWASMQPIPRYAVIVVLAHATALAALPCVLLVPGVPAPPPAAVPASPSTLEASS
jgi:hypothetical protein